MPELKVMPNEVAGWDVVREGEGVALSNHPTRESAEEAARLRAAEEHLSDNGGAPAVVVDAEHVHPIDDTRSGMRTYFIVLGAILVAVTILVAILSLTGSLTGFGS
jgi:Uncharacterized protein conserved in bacteria (DUF2188)